MCLRRRSRSALLVLFILTIGNRAWAEFSVQSVRGECRIDGEIVVGEATTEGGLIAIPRDGEMILGDGHNVSVSLGGNTLVVLETHNQYNLIRILHGRVMIVGAVSRWRVFISPFTMALSGEAYGFVRRRQDHAELTIGRGEIVLRDHRPDGVGRRLLAAENGASWRAVAMAGGLTTFSYYEPPRETLELFSTLGRRAGYDLVWSPWDRGTVDRVLSSSER